MRLDEVCRRQTRQIYKAGPGDQQNREPARRRFQACKRERSGQQCDRGGERKQEGAGPKRRVDQRAVRIELHLRVVAGGYWNPDREQRRRYFVDDAYQRDGPATDRSEDLGHDYRRQQARRYGGGVAGGENRHPTFPSPLRRGRRLCVRRLAAPVTHPAWPRFSGMTAILFEDFPEGLPAFGQGDYSDVFAGNGSGIVEPRALGPGPWRRPRMLPDDSSVLFDEVLLEVFFRPRFDAFRDPGQSCDVTSEVAEDGGRGWESQVDVSVVGAFFGTSPDAYFRARTERVDDQVEGGVGGCGFAFFLVGHIRPLKTVPDGDQIEVFCAAGDRAADSKLCNHAFDQRRVPPPLGGANPRHRFQGPFTRLALEYRVTVEQLRSAVDGILDAFHVRGNHEPSRVGDAVAVIGAEAEWEIEDEPCFRLCVGDVQVRRAVRFTSRPPTQPAEVRSRDGELRSVDEFIVVHFDCGFGAPGLKVAGSEANATVLEREPRGSGLASQGVGLPVVGVDDRSIAVPKVEFAAHATQDRQAAGLGDVCGVGGFELATAEGVPVSVAVCHVEKPAVFGRFRLPLHLLEAVVVAVSGHLVDAVVEVEAAHVVHMDAGRDRSHEPRRAAFFSLDQQVSNHQAADQVGRRAGRFVRFGAVEPEEPVEFAVEFQRRTAPVALEDVLEGTVFVVGFVEQESGLEGDDTAREKDATDRLFFRRGYCFGQRFAVLFSRVGCVG